MSLNWVMLSSDKKQFTPLPGEQQIYTSSPRTGLSLKTLPGYPGTDPFSIDSATGTLFLTNRRAIYLPSTPSQTFESFASPILNLHDTHVSVPWFGANIWTALVQPVPGGGISTACPAIELKLTFKDGGAFDFHSRFERIKERLQHAVDVARESGAGLNGDAGGNGGMGGVDLGQVHLEDLPAYEAEGVARERYTERDAGVQQVEGISSEPPRYEDIR